MTTRQQQRTGYDVPVRLSLLENDVDELEQRLAELGDRLKTIQGVLVGLLISVTTGSVLVAINILVMHR